MQAQDGQAKRVSILGRGTGSLDRGRTFLYADLATRFCRNVREHAIVLYTATPWARAPMVLL